MYTRQELKQMNEQEIRSRLISPAIKKRAGQIDRLAKSTASKQIRNLLMDK